MRRSIFLYGLALAGLLILLKWLEWRFVVFDHAIEVYSGALAVVFTGVGIWLAIKLARPKVHTVVMVRPASEAPGQEIDEKELARLGLSGREQEVLQLMAEGLSNQEIADRLFLSLNTVKTHCSRIFDKLDVRRRTQAIEVAKRLRLIR
ncbi:MAG TPA: response regulator transcription factor [Puia sp.]|nr:response regulator transcription factor [Puia sp.]